MLVLSLELGFEVLYMYKLHHLLVVFLLLEFLDNQLYNIDWCVIFVCVLQARV